MKAAARMSTTTSHQPRAAIVGGSLGGLAAANALLSAGWKYVDVYERAPGPLHEKGSGLGYVNIPLWEALRHETPMMRRGRRASRQQGSYYYGDLWKYLYEGLPENTVKFGRTIESLTVNDATPYGGASTVSIGDESYDLVVVADGGFSNLRKYVLGDASSCDSSNKVKYQLEPEYAGYVVWRGSVPISKIPRNVLKKIQEGVYKNGIYDTIVLQQAKDNGEDLWTMGTFIETPEADVTQYWNKATDGASRHGTTASASKVRKMPDWLLKHFQMHFADAPGLVELMECMKEYGEVTPHPQYEFGAVERVHRGRVVIIGDTAHMASPRTAVGAHTAILDALGLMEAFSVEPSDIDLALKRYSRSGLRRAHELYARTREISLEFVSRRNEHNVDT
jgi:2-polyprenyl-6-methoxyphenol hydroxylase-like FAD-dependent oxidoreductase